MSKVERKEYHETKVVKTRGSTQDLAQFDNNLDYLLEDLQSSVPKPQPNTGSNTYRETRATREVDHGRSNSLNRVTHMKASNPVTEYLSDDSYNYTSPDGTKQMKSYKKESYSYSSGGNSVAPEALRMQNNINQLDSLLDDLKQVKQGANNSAGVDPGLVETSKSRVVMGKKTVERELHYGDTPPRSSSRTRTLDRSEREGSLTREIQYIDEGTYGETKPIRYTPSPSHSQASTLTKQKKVTNIHSYPPEVIETTTPEINPEILSHLDPNLLPSGNTKVTTTIKTYTYEIPGSGYKPVSPDSEKYVYSPNQSQTTPSKSFVYSKVENNDVTNVVAYPPPPTDKTTKTNIYKETTTSNQVVPPYQKPAPPQGADTTIIKETTTTRNYQPGYQVYPEPPPTGKQTYIYNETTTTRNINEGYPDDPHYRPVIHSPDDPHYRPVRHSPDDPHPRPIRQSPAPGKETYIIKETHNTTTNRTTGPYHNGYPPQEPPGPTTIIYKQDTHTTNYGAPPPHRQVPPNTTVVYTTDTNTTDNYDPNRYPYPGRPGDSPQSRRPNEPYDPNNVNITYKYSSHSTTSNRYGGYPEEESQPLLRPQPFPSDGELDGPPKRVDQLMATIGKEPPDSPLNAGFQAHEAELAHQKKVDTLKHSQQQKEPNDVQKKERNLPPTKNITGPPVYYPPGHEMFAKKEESGAWRAEGAMARESGRYRYEAESGSKTKVRSGAAVVPVCLPLCCGIPCTIM